MEPVMQLPGILGLPFDILHQILALLQQEYKCLRLVCTQLNYVVEPELLSSLVIDENTFKPGACQLEMLAAQKSRASSYTRTLTIKSLVASSSAKENALEAHECEARMREHLGLAISSLTSLQCVTWTITHTDAQWTQNIVVNALATLPLLQHVHFTVDHLTTLSLPLNRLSGLKKITILGICGVYRSRIISTLADAIAQSPHLTQLVVRSHFWEASEETPALHELLAKVPVGASLRLEHLVLHRMLFRIDDFTLPHLRSLTFLDLSDLLPLYDQRDTPSSELLNRLETYHSTITDIFTTLTRERIYLRGIIVTELCKAAIDYLGSYSGILEQLEATNFDFDSTTESDALAERFYSFVLPKHASAIQVLYILPWFEGGWCWNDQALTVLSECIMLKSLCIAFPAMGDEAAMLSINDGDNVKFDDMISSWIDLSFMLPHLTEIGLCAAGPAAYRDCSCATTTVRHLGCMRLAILESIKRFKLEDKAKLPQTVLPNLRVKDEVYKFEVMSGSYKKIPVSHGRVRWHAY